MAQLYLLHPQFSDPQNQRPGRYFCPDCMIMEGLLAQFPVLRENLEIRHVDYPRPRPALTALLGPENQGCPVLVLTAAEAALVPGLPYKTQGPHQFLQDPPLITAYLAQRFHTPEIH